MTKAKECRRILSSGAKCHALALQGTPYCYFHQALRSFDQENRTRGKSVLVPRLEDRASIQMAIMSVLDALGASKMDPVRARSYLYGLQLAMQNLGRDRELVVRDSVYNPVCPDEGEFLAPEEEEEEEQKKPEPAAEELHPEQGAGFDSRFTQSESIGDSAPEQCSAPVSSPIPSLSADCLAADETLLEPPEESPEESPEEPQEEPGNNQAWQSHRGSADPQAAAALTVDISAAADDDNGPADPPAGSALLARYGSLHPWDFDDRELTEPEIKKRKSIARIVKFLAIDVLAVTPYKTASQRRSFREQLRSEYFTKYLTPAPEPRQCEISKRYLAGMFS